MLRIAIVFSLLLSLIACSRESNKTVQGYIEGQYTYVSSSVPGYLQKINVERGSQVKRGDILFELDQQPEASIVKESYENLQQTKAARAATEANLAFAHVTFERNKILLTKGAIQRSELDRTKANLDALEAERNETTANIAEAEANLAKAKWDLEQKKMYAPIAGMVFDTYYRLGEYTKAGQTVLSILAPENVKVIFYVPEPSLAELKINEAVEVTCDQCTKKFTGKITFISPSAEYTPPVIYSNETSSKLIYRIEAKFDLQTAVQLHPGQPVRVTYKLNS